MSKHRLYICLIVAVLVILLGLVIVPLYKDLPYLYYGLFTSPRELPTRQIRPIFYRLAQQELPQKADGLRAIFLGGRDQTIFVRFQTDSEGLAYILEKFGGTGVVSATYDGESIIYDDASIIYDGNIAYTPASGTAILTTLFQAQKRLGIYIFDPDFFKSVRMLSKPGHPRGIPGHSVFINDQTRTVCIGVWTY